MEQQRNIRRCYTFGSANISALTSHCVDRDITSRVVIPPQTRYLARRRKARRAPTGDELDFLEVQIGIDERGLVPNDLVDATRRREYKSALLVALETSKGFEKP